MRRSRAGCSSLTPVPSWTGLQASTGISTSSASTGSTPRWPTPSRLLPSRKRDSRTSRPVELILASGSPRREMLLRQIGLNFQVEPSGAGENIPEDAAPRELAEKLAVEKARLVASRRSSGLVIGADTVVMLGSRALGK